jgi:hypothetical protein
MDLGANKMSDFFAKTYGELSAVGFDPATEVLVRSGWTKVSRRGDELVLENIVLRVHGE